MSKTTQELYDELAHLVETGDVDAIQSFLLDNIADFPEEIQQKIAFSAFEVAVSEEAETVGGIDEIQEKLLEALTVIDGVEEEIENQERIDELKKELNVPEEK